MSTFTGEIKEIPGISVDNFTNTSLKYYFLSHCHMDHLIGIKDFKDSELPIYTTELSAMILRKQYPDINVNHIVMGVPTNFEIIDDSSHVTRFTITLLNCGHCLGSCMFFFQTENHDILYTGDFRFTKADAQNMHALNSARTYGKLIIYLDTTFMKNQYKYFPRQKESCQKVIEIVENHLKVSHKNKVILKTSARFGYERLVIELFEKLNEKVFVFDKNVMELYLMISGISKCITTSENYSRVFLTSGSRKKFFDEVNDESCLKIHLSAMYWTNLDEKQSFVRAEGKNKLRICYATHSSLSEIQDILYFLKPIVIHPTVLPENFNERTKMLKLIDEIVNYDKKEIEPKKRFAFKKLRQNS